MAENIFLSFELSKEQKYSGIKLLIVNSANITQIIVSKDIRLCLIGGSSASIPITEFNCNLLNIDYARVI